MRSTTRGSVIMEIIFISVPQEQSMDERELKHFWPKLDFIEVTRQICEQAGRIAPRSRLRSLDAIHLATFFWIKELEPTIKMLTFDERILREL